MDLSFPDVKKWIHTLIQLFNHPKVFEFSGKKPNSKFGLSGFGITDQSLEISGSSPFCSSKYLFDGEIQVVPGIEISCNIDKIQQYNDLPLIQIHGWAFLESLIGNQIQKVPADTIQLILKSKARIYVIDTILVSRPDVAEYYKDPHLMQSGFSALFEKTEIENGRYQIGIRCQRDPQSSRQKISQGIFTAAQSVEEILETSLMKAEIDPANNENQDQSTDKSDLTVILNLKNFEKLNPSFRAFIQILNQACKLKIVINSAFPEKQGKKFFRNKISIIGLNNWDKLEEIVFSEKIDIAIQIEYFRDSQKYPNFRGPVVRLVPVFRKQKHFEVAYFSLGYETLVFLTCPTQMPSSKNKVFQVNKEFSSQFKKLLAQINQDFKAKNQHRMKFYQNLLALKQPEKQKNIMVQTAAKVWNRQYCEIHSRLLVHILKIHTEKPLIVFPQGIIDWNTPLFQRSHHIANQLAQQGFLYFFGTPNDWQDNVYGFTPVSESLFLTNRIDLLMEVSRRKIFHLWSTDNTTTTDFVRNAIQRGDLILYEYVDEIEPKISGKPIPEETWKRHQYIVSDERCMVVATADKLLEEVKKSRRRNMGLCTNGVDYAHFSNRISKNKAPEQIKSLLQCKKPIIGYMGALANWFDYELVLYLARKRPQYRFVLIGPNYDGSMNGYPFGSCPNIHYLGVINYEILPQYAQFFDVAMIPFKLNSITESTSPIKLFEFMAMGIPIISTNIRECRKYRSVKIVKNKDEFIFQLDELLKLPGDSGLHQILKKEALQNSWELKAKLISDMIAKNL